MALKRKSPKESISKNQLFGMVTLFCALGVYITRAISLDYNGLQAGLAVPIEGQYFIWANTMHVLCALFVIGVIMLSVSQEFRYFPIIGASRKKAMTDKQWALRNKVFERSYFLMVLGVLLTVWLVNDWHNFILIKEGDMFTNGDRIYPLWTTLLLLLGLPSIVASSHKDA